MELDILAAGLGVVSTALAALFWLWASLIKVPDNIDTFIAELQRVGRINAYGALCAFAAALCATYAFARQGRWL